MKKLVTTARISEIDDTSDRIIVLFEEEVSLQEDEILKGIISEIKSISSKLTRSIKRDVVLSKLQEADKKRDDIIRSLNKVLIGYQSMRSEEIKENATKINGVFSKYGIKMIKENYTTKSSYIESFLNDISTSEYQHSLSVLSGFADWVSELRKEQTSFNQQRVAYEKAISIYKNEPSASALKKPMLDLINGKLITYLSAMKMFKTQEYSEFVNAVQQAIDTTNDAIRKRGKQPKKEEII